jgi:hypothetical protein
MPPLDGWKRVAPVHTQGRAARMSLPGASFSGPRRRGRRNSRRLPDSIGTGAVRDAGALTRWWRRDLGMMRGDGCDGEAHRLDALAWRPGPRLVRSANAAGAPHRGA